ncbi:MAG TPA: hypothetical protein VK841_25120 [Polyangiaceae bacterium]|nr:hypothetical protein [Polyangiaceae bacterium]
MASLSVTAACGSTSHNGPPLGVSANGSDAGPAYEGGLPSAALDGGVLDCAWVMGANCWKSTIGVAESCLPPFDPNHLGAGQLNADLTMCSYPTGQTVSFTGLTVNAGPVTFAVMSDRGAPCLAGAMTTSASEYAFSATTTAGTVTYSVDSTMTTVMIACTDGTNVSGTAVTLAPCEDALPFVELGSSSASSGFLVVDGGSDGGPASATVVFTLTLTLDGTGMDGGTPVFSCGTSP